MTEIEVFEAGQWADVEWTERDLDEMAENFERLGRHGRVPVKLGHGARVLQGVAEDGQPAIGWVASLRRSGRKLLATLRDVPQALQEAVAAGRYAKVSAEIYPAFEHTGAGRNLVKNFGLDVRGRVLGAVAFLGATIPEVRSLDDLPRVLGCAFTEAPLDKKMTAVTRAHVQPRVTEAELWANLRKLQADIAALQQAQAERAAAFSAPPVARRAEDYAADLNAAMETIAARDGLDLRVAAQRQKAAETVVRERRDLVEARYRAPRPPKPKSPGLEETNKRFAELLAEKLRARGIPPAVNGNVAPKYREVYAEIVNLIASEHPELSAHFREPHLWWAPR